MQTPPFLQSSGQELTTSVLWCWSEADESTNMDQPLSTSVEAATKSKARRETDIMTTLTPKPEFRNVPSRRRTRRSQSTKRLRWTMKKVRGRMIEKWAGRVKCAGEATLIMCLESFERESENGKPPPCRSWLYTRKRSRSPHPPFFGFLVRAASRKTNTSSLPSTTVDRIHSEGVRCLDHGDHHLNDPFGCGFILARVPDSCVGSPLVSELVLLGDPKELPLPTASVLGYSRNGMRIGWGTSIDSALVVDQAPVLTHSHTFLPLLAA